MNNMRLAHISRHRAVRLRTAVRQSGCTRRPSESSRNVTSRSSRRLHDTIDDTSAIDHRRVRPVHHARRVLSVSCTSRHSPVTAASPRAVAESPRRRDAFSPSRLVAETPSRRVASIRRVAETLRCRGRLDRARAELNHAPFTASPDVLSTAKHDRNGVKNAPPGNKTGQECR